MSAICVLIGDMPELLTCLVVEMLRNEPDIILCKIDDGETSPADKIDVVVTSADTSAQHRPLTLREVVALRPSGILSIDSARETAQLINIDLHEWQLRENDRDNLAAAIRAAAKAGWRH